MTSQLTQWLSNPTYDYTPDEIYDEIEGDTVASDVWDTLIEDVLPALRRGVGRGLGGLVYTVGSDTYTTLQRKAIFLAVEQGFKEADVMRFTANAILQAGSPTVFWGHTLKMIDRIRHAFGTAQDRVIEDYVKLLKKAHASWGKTGWVVQGDFKIGMGMIPAGDSIPTFEKTTGDFVCANLRLLSLKGCPQEVGGVFFCSANMLESLKGGPEIVGKDYFCDNNRIKTLEGAPKRIPGEFLAFDNDLKDLRGAPSFIGQGFSVSNNALRSLEGGPKHVGGGYNAEMNAVLTSIKGVAKYIDGDFTCDSAMLRSLEPLLKSTVTGHVDTRFGYFESWPPPEGTVLTASSDHLPAPPLPPRVAAPSLKRWLKNPTYDDVPREVDEDLEDNARAEIWDILIEKALPALRRGDKRVLASYQPLDIGNAWTLNQVVAFLYAVKEGFREQDLLTFFAPMLLEERLGVGQLDEAGMRRYHEVLLGKSRQALTTPYHVIEALKTAQARWSPKGWVTSSTRDVWLSALQLEALPLFAETKGSFNCSTNKLTTLKGSPRKVGGDFDCSGNRLTTLDGVPVEIEGLFLGERNPQLKSYKALLNSKIGGSVMLDFGDFNKWPPSPSDPLSHAASVKEGSSLERWLDAPTYDWTPNEVYDEVEEDTVASDVWDILIEQTLPALRKGEKRTLDRYAQQDLPETLTPLQLRAFFRAVETGFDEEDILEFLAPKMLSDRSWIPRLSALGMERYTEIFFGYSQTNHKAQEYVREILKNKNSVWSPYGWISKGPRGPDLRDIELLRLPKMFKVTGTFDCSINALKTLEGAPALVGGDFNCEANALRSLEGAPRTVLGSFYCRYNSRLKSLKPLLKSKIKGRVFSDLGTVDKWPPDPRAFDNQHLFAEVKEASRASEDRWFRDPSYEGAPPRIEKLMDSMSVEQEVWYEIIETYVPALRAGKKGTLDFLIRTYEQYNADQMKALLYAAERGFKRSGEHVALAVNYMLYNPLMVAARIAEPAFKVDISKNSQLFNRLVGVFKDSRAHYTPQGWVVPGSLNLGELGLTVVPPIASVGKDLLLLENKLTSLEGCPRKVPGDFQCGGNQLTTLEGGPDWVGEDYYCYGNKLKDLRGAPSYVGNDFYCYQNPLKSLEGKPRHIGGLFEAE